MPARTSWLSLVRRSTAPTLAQAAAGPLPSAQAASSVLDRTTTFVDQLGERVFQAQSFGASCIAWVRTVASSAAQAIVEAAGDGANVALLVRAKGTGNTYIAPGGAGGYVELRDHLATSVLRVDAVGLGFHGAAPSAQGGAIADSTDADAQIGGKINTILAVLRTKGLIAT